MISCNYNGWTDLPEDEREALDQLEASRPVQATALVILPPSPIIPTPQRQAA